MLRLKTGNEQLGEIEWRLEIEWQHRAQLFALDAIQDAGEMGLIINTIQVVQAIYPECVKGWSKPEAITDATFWGVNFQHLYDLALQVGTWLWLGVNLTDEREKAKAAEAEDAETIPFDTAAGPATATE